MYFRFLLSHSLSVVFTHRASVCLVFSEIISSEETDHLKQTQKTNEIPTLPRGGISVWLIMRCIMAELDDHVHFSSFWNYKILIFSQHLGFSHTNAHSYYLISSLSLKYFHPDLLELYKCCQMSVQAFRPLHYCHPIHPPPGSGKSIAT